MRTYLWAAVALFLVLPANSFADDEIKPEQLKKMYDDALGQLKSAQDRKAELAKENEALSAKVVELQKQLAASQEQVSSLKQQVADNTDKTYYLRSYHAAWERFLKRSPELMASWKVYLGTTALSFSAEAADLPALDFKDLFRQGDDRDRTDDETARLNEPHEAPIPGVGQ